LPPVPPIDSEIGVDGPDMGTGVHFAHADQTGVRKVHRDIVIFVQQPPDGPSFGIKIKFNPDNPPVV